MFGYDWNLRLRFHFTFPSFFFLLFIFFFQRMNSKFTVQRQRSLFMHCSSTVHAFKNIKNESHGTFHTFKNYFVTVFSVFSFQFSVSTTISSIQTYPKLRLLVNTTIRPVVELRFQKNFYDFMRFWPIRQVLNLSSIYYESVWIELIVAETENWKLKTL